MSVKHELVSDWFTAGVFPQGWIWFKCKHCGWSKVFHTRPRKQDLLTYFELHIAKEHTLPW